MPRSVKTPGRLAQAHPPGRPRRLRRGDRRPLQEQDATASSATTATGRATAAWRWARQHGIAVRDARGRVVRMVGSTGDITELKRVELALKESQDRYALATLGGDRGHLRVEPRHRLALPVRARQGVLRACAARRSRRRPGTRRVHRRGLPRLSRRARRLLQGPRRRTSSTNTASATPPAATPGSSTAPSPMRDGRAACACAWSARSRDVTQRKQHELELRRARDEATEALERQTATAEILKVIGQLAVGRAAGVRRDREELREAVRRRRASSFASSKTVSCGRRRASARARMPPVPVDRDSGAGGLRRGRAPRPRCPIWPRRQRPTPACGSSAMKHGYRSGICSPLMRGGRAIGDDLRAARTSRAPSATRKSRCSPPSPTRR